VREVRIHPDTGIAEVIVPDFQLSLAIGKEGQNARLAARLSGWRVDIKSESQLAEEESGGGVEYAEGEWVENPSGELVWQPAEGGETISAAEAGYASPDLGAAVGGEGADGDVKPPMDPTSLGDKPSPTVPPPAPKATAPESPAEGGEEPTAPSPQPEAVSAPAATIQEEKEG
jgi:N utilization substance protein A